MKKPHKFYFHVKCMVQHLQHVFHIVSMHFSCGNNTNSSKNVICVKKSKLFYPNKFKMLVKLLFNHEVLVWFLTKRNYRIYKYEKVQEEELHQELIDVHMLK
jgi:hypothetical protein